MFNSNRDVIESENKLSERVALINTEVLSFTTPDTNVKIGYLSRKTDIIDGDQAIINYMEHCDAEFRAFYMCEENKLVPNNTLCKCQKHVALTKIIQEWKLGIADVAKMYLIYKWLQYCFKDIDQLAVNICVTLINIILQTNRSLTLTNRHYCSTTILSFFELKRISQCRFVHIKSTEYEDFPYWSFGVHPSKNNEFLVGYLYIHKLYGTLMLKDSNYKILCLITNQSELLEKVINCFILINKFYVITEIYKDSNVYNLECILVDFKDIRLLRHINCENIQTHSNTENLNPEHYIRFQLKSLSVTKLCEMNTPEIWLLTYVVDCDDANLKDNLLLCITYEDIPQVLPHLMEGWYYKLVYDGTLRVLFNKELKRFYPDYKQMRLCSQNVAFTIEKAPQEERQVMNVLQCKNYIATFPQELVSFQGKIKSKRFANPISSRSLRESSLHGFGTSGPRTHYLEFAVEGSDVKTLTVYINNWESNITPFGLVPGMVCVVNNVSHQKGKYCKATPLTSFKIIQYEPEVQFTTVNLFTGECIDWGTPFYFSLGHKISYGVLVWSKVYSLRIRSLKITNKCASCNCSVTALRCQCSDASTSVIEPHFWITLFVEDMYGSARIISSCQDLLRLILNLGPHEWETWKQAFQRIDYYEYNTESMDKRTENVLLSEMLTNAVKVVNYVDISNIELCCRKIYSKGDAKIKYECPVWYCIRARRTESCD